MSIAHELSCDVATAMLTEKENAHETTAADLSEIVLTVHSTLRQMTVDERARRRSTLTLPTTNQGSSAAASSH